ncbi:MAG: response regulator transcription factor [Mycobacterium sp.]|jgi:DNA-binding NarL/FixJ family response regulator
MTGSTSHPAPFVVVIVDDHALFAQGLQLLLASRADRVFDVAAIGGSSEDAVPLVGKHHADIVTIDLTLPPRGGVHAIAAVRAAYPSTGILALSGTDDLSLAERALRAGADGFLQKTSDADALVAPLLVIAAGMKVLNTELLDRLLMSNRTPDDGLLDGLDEQHIKLWSLLAQGLEINAIADRMHVSERTTKRMVASLIHKIGARNRIEAAALAGRYGLLDRRTIRAGGNRGE